MRMDTYAMIEWCAALRNHVDVKRVLMSDEGMREEYGRVAGQLEEREFANIGEYAMAKNEILWKNFGGCRWSGEDLEEVRKVNS
jgi:hypothetical protein